MTLRKKLQKLGGSVALVLPKSVAEAAGLYPGDEVTISVRGSTVVVMPASGGEVEFAKEDEFERARQRVLERYGETFRLLADHDETRSG